MTDMGASASRKKNSRKKREWQRMPAVDRWTGGVRRWCGLRRKTLLLLSTVCMAAAVQAADAPAEKAAAGEVVVTIKPLHALVQSVLGDTRRARLLVDGYASPHGYSLKPSQVGAINRAAAVFLIAPEFEGFLKKALAAAPQSVRQYPLAEKAKLELLKVREGGAWEAHHHHDEDGHEDGDAHAHEAKPHEEKPHEGKHDDHHHHEAHEAHEEKNGESHGLEYDMHVWLSPVHAQSMLRVIAQELGSIYPEQKALFVRNAETEIQRIQALDGRLKKQLLPVQKQPYIVFHDAYQYFEKHYGLNAVGSITLEPDESPSVQRIRQIRERIKKQEVRCVFSEPQFSDKLLRTVITDDAVRTAELDPLGAEVSNGAGAYSAILQKLADATVECLR